MIRPFIKNSINEIEKIFEKALIDNDIDTLNKLSYELTYRKTTRAQKIKQSIELGTRNIIKSHNKSKQKISNIPFKNNPTQEQIEAREAFLKGGSLTINAYAGTGKTSTLQLLSHSTKRRGQYIAFNRDIVNDGKKKFPETVNCSTIHSLAYKAAPSTYKNDNQKMTGKINAYKLAELLGLEKDINFGEKVVLKPLSQGNIILKTIRQFTQCGDREFNTKHVPHHGAVITSNKNTLQSIEEFAIKHAKHVWARMLDPGDIFPLGHDGYLKMWALSEPILLADFILLDEAQDTNPVVLEVLKNQPAQMIYVGDRFQQIYEWRGAINAMEEIKTDNLTFLTKSFRFGDEIADASNKILSLIEKLPKPIEGNPNIRSRIGITSPQTILARTNASVMSAVIDILNSDRKPHLVGGNGELMEMLKGVEDLKNNQPSMVPDFFGFNNWNEVVEFAKSSEGEHLLTFVNLVESRGERQLMWALNRTVNEANCDMVISTAHKSKGREWSKVRLMDDFLKSSPRQSKGNNGYDPAELRLFYVALTRAREEMEIPSNLMPLITQGETTSPVNNNQSQLSKIDSPLLDLGKSSFDAIEVKHSSFMCSKPPKIFKDKKVDFIHDAENKESSGSHLEEGQTIQQKIMIEDRRQKKEKGFFGWLFGK